jgi:hypothetical protein
MAAAVPLKSNRVPISLAVFSTAFFTSTMLGSQTVSNEGIWSGPRESLGFATILP